MNHRPSRQELLGFKGSELPLREFLDLFGERVRRPANVYSIGQAMSDAGLATLPDFATCGMGDKVQVVALVTAVPQARQSEVDAPEGESLPSSALPRRLLIGDLPSARAGVRSVSVNSALSQVTYLMRHRGCDQVPVTTGMTTLHGVITWRSLALMYERGKEPTLENAMQQESLPVADGRQEFFACLPELIEQGYLLVRRDDASLSGIVTHAHVIDRFKSAAYPFFLLGEIESLLRRWLGTRLSEEAILAVQANKKAELRTGKVGDLMFGDYVCLVDGEQRKTSLAQRADLNWTALQCDSLDRVQFVRHLQKVQEIRNRIAHFDAEPLPPEAMEELTAFTALLRDYVG
ncbi:CBS domain-containing protein [Streptomyces sp. ISL-11]|uniref:CBS domain-containing protein n=1 Tax=Streptomyces sp. ISL-11 TaxID=2819174 RepID=UPI001BE973D8|nr:CBS domain-containing protein [Streptomyces sp. ISL-11]MBT2386650.1 CBS domain-containing protein [Streptomyces sp. ISL-11]